MSTFYLLITTAVVLAFFRVARLIGIRNTIVQRMLPLLSILELGLWTIIIFWSVSIFLSTRSYYPYLVVVLAVLFTFMITWFYLKDIVAGFIFRTRHSPIKGQILTCESIHGSVRLLGLSQLTIETEAGQWIRIPYSTIVNRSLSLQSPRQVMPGETTVELEAVELKNPGSVERTLKKILAQSPWCVTSKPITIQIMPEAEKIKLSFFLLDPFYLPMVKARLHDALEKRSEQIIP